MMGVCPPVVKADCIFCIFEYSYSFEKCILQQWSREDALCERQLRSRVIVPLRDAKPGERILAPFEAWSAVRCCQYVIYACWHVLIQYMKALFKEIKAHEHKKDRKN